MSSSEELYREVILDHTANPRRHKPLAAPSLRQRGHNPLCGDECELELVVEDGRIRDIAVLGQGCSISQASGSIMAEAIAGKSVAEARELLGKFKDYLIEDKPIQFAPAEDDIRALEGVKKHHVRIKCAVLAWNTLGSALDAAEKKAG